MHRYTESDRERVFQLIDLYGKDYKRISEETGVSPQLIRYWVSRREVKALTQDIPPEISDLRKFHFQQFSSILLRGYSTLTSLLQPRILKEKFKRASLKDMAQATSIYIRALSELQRDLIAFASFRKEGPPLKVLEDLQLSKQELSELLETKKTHKKTIEPEETKEDELEDAVKSGEEPILSKEEIFSLAQEINSDK